MIRTSFHQRRSRVLPISALILAACTTWRPIPPDLRITPTAPLPRGVRVTRPDGSRVMMVWPRVRGDTLYGVWYRDTVRVPLADVSRLEREQLSLPRTLALGVGLPVAVIGSLYLIMCGSGQCRPDY